MEPLVRALLGVRTFGRRGHGLLVACALGAFVVFGGAAAEMGPAQGVALAVWALLITVRVRRKLRETTDAPLLLDVEIGALLSGTAREEPQDASQATYFGGRTPEDGRIDWTRSSVDIFNLIRAVTDPYPGAFTDVGDRRLMVWWAAPGTPSARGREGRPGEVLSASPLVVATGDGALELTRVEWRGGVKSHLAAGQTL